MKEEKIPWWVRENLSPAKVREHLLANPRQEMGMGMTHEDFVRRKENHEIKVDRRANVAIQCPSCRQRLSQFYITRDEALIKRAKQNHSIFKLITAYVCWHPCFKVFFYNDVPGVLK